MNHTTFRRLAPLGAMSCVLLVCLISTSRARGEFLGNLIEVHVSSEGHAGSWLLEVAPTSDPFYWALAAPVEIYSTAEPSRLLATIDSLNVEVDGDPQVLLNFAVTAGAVNTTFAINSASVSFAALNNPQSFATAAITLTDNNGDGASLSGLFAGNKAYQATYNGGSEFASLVSPIVTDPDSSNIGSQRNPLSGTVAIPGSVSSIQTGLSFVLSATDAASGTTRFTVIVPEPSTMVLGVFAGVALLVTHRRRQRLFNR